MMRKCIFDTKRLLSMHYSLWRAIHRYTTVFKVNRPDTGGKKFPNEKQVVVCGGGVTGASVLYHLAERGWTDSILLEKGKFTSGTTWHAAGLISNFRSDVYVELCSYSKDLYEWMEENGYPTGFKKCGSLMLASSSERLIYLKRIADSCRLRGIQSEELSVNDIARHSPWVNTEGLKGAIVVPDDAVGSPVDICNSLIKLAKDKGAHAVERCNVERIETSGGRVKSVYTNLGKINCEYVVLCGGLWTRDLGTQIQPSLNIPLHSAEHFYLITKPIEGVDTMHPDGHYKPIMHRFPFLKKAEIREMFNGPESFTPDGLHFLGESPEVENLFIGAGMNSSGIVTAGGNGRILAELMNGEKPFVNLTKLDIKRCLGHQGNNKFLNDRTVELLGIHYSISFPNQSFPELARPMKTSNLYPFHKTNGAIFGVKNEVEFPLWFSSKGTATQKYTFEKPSFFDDVGKEYNICKNGVGVIDLTSQWSLWKLESMQSEVVRELQHLCFSNIDIPVGTFVQTGMLDKFGCYVLECYLLRESTNSFLMLCPLSAETYVRFWLKKQKVKGVSLTNLTSSYTFLGLVGSHTKNIFSLLDVEFPKKNEYKKSEIGYASGILTLQSPSMPLGSVLLCIESPFVIGMRQVLLDVGSKIRVAEVGTQVLNWLRVEEGIPAWGYEYDTGKIPFLGDISALSCEKDYLGKNAIMSAVESKENREFLVHFTININTEGNVWPWGGEPLCMDGFQVGRTTSIGYSYQKNCHTGLGIVNSTLKFKHEQSLELLNVGQRLKVNNLKIF
ncbi:pyruvate dehydrogenase phosphatase regulatory subunit, mitochondrial-like isoform X2 [Tachypleus tridentatus]|uniref:pyruvate dehydrogenase phosphatase regulatory subunit, mitochondrial-like isoform X2 n=1 Tax=Tachypleus tridentatus TaxID=6853 RepID=UPI003FCF51F5